MHCAQASILYWVFSDFTSLCSLNSHFLICEMGSCETCEAVGKYKMQDPSAVCGWRLKHYAFSLQRCGPWLCPPLVIPSQGPLWLTPNQQAIQSRCQTVLGEHVGFSDNRATSFPGHVSLLVDKGSWMTLSSGSGD